MRKLNLREKIKKECGKQGTDLKTMLEKANVNRCNYSKQFIAIWKPRIAGALGVDEEDFFNGYESEIKMSRPIKFRVDYAEKKAKLIAALKNGWVTITEIRELTDTDAKGAAAMLSGIRYGYIVETKAIKGSRNKLYRITGEIKKGESVQAVPIADLPIKINKLDLLTWGINQAELKFNTSHDLVAYAKQHGKRVYLLNDNGGYKWL